jgi:large subunit ribosomal protein LP2
MRHLAAYLLLLIGGNATPSETDITNLLATAGIDVDTERLTQLLAELDGKNVEELVALGKEKLMVGAAVAASAGPAGGNAAPAPAAEETKKEEKPKVEEVDALDGGMDMFGGGGGGGDY